jgi:hypothetical protein
MPMNTHHTQVAAHLPMHHRDPMDRLIIGQAIAENMTIVSADGAFAGYSVRLLWERGHPRSRRMSSIGGDFGCGGRGLRMIGRRHRAR